jgi:hypothetical protein
VVELARLVEDFAVAIRHVDARGLQAVGARTGRAYQPGIGPHSESEAIKLVADELAALTVCMQHMPSTCLIASRQRCDWCLGSPPSWDCAIEAKLLRLFGDNGKINDNMLTHILSPYPAQRSAPTDCDKLVASGLRGRKAILIFGYDYPPDGVESCGFHAAPVAQLLIQIAFIAGGITGAWLMHKQDSAAQ